MTLHAITRYLSYRWKAKGLHGTHSPFVYDFIEKVLHDREVIPKEYIVSCPNLPLRFENILSRIAARYQYRAIVRLPDCAPEKPGVTPDMVVLNEADPGNWTMLFNEYNGRINQNGIMVVIGIYKTPAHTAAWNKLRLDPRVRMSIDLYGFGLLLFRQEFKEPQHFILRY